MPERAPAASTRPADGGEETPVRRAYASTDDARADVGPVRAARPRSTHAPTERGETAPDPARTRAMTAETGATLVVGDTTVDLYPPSDASFEPGGGLEWHVGGTATNAARWLAALGGDAALLTNVGDDAVGRAAERHLNAGPVDTEHVARVDAPSPLTLYVPTADGARWDAWVAGSCYGFTPPDDPASLVAPRERLHVEGVTLPTEVNRTGVRRLVEAAAENGVSVSLDLNGRENQWETAGAYRAALREVLSDCDLVFAGTEDLSVAGVDPSPTGLLELLPADASMTAFVTDGAAETTAMRVADGRIRERETAAPPSVSVAVAAGAGDAFAGAVLAALADGTTDLGELTAVGNAAGAAAVATVAPFDPKGPAAVAELLRES